MVFPQTLCQVIMRKYKVDEREVDDFILVIISMHVFVYIIFQAEQVMYTTIDDRKSSLSDSESGL